MRENRFGTAIGALACALAVAAVIASPAVLAPHHALAAAAPDSAFAAEESSATTPVPLPLQMADVADAQQLLVATAPHLGDTTGTLQVFDLVDGVWVTKLTVSARFGTHGLMDGTLRVAGNRTTPTGIWRMPAFVFGTHARAPKGTLMHYRRLTRNTWWSSRRGATYNTWVKARRWTGEHIGTSPTAYEFAISVGYNALPNTSVYGRGTGIFLHVRGRGLTAGCVAVSRSNMIRICRLLDRSKHPHFAVGTLDAGTPTSIWAY
jgi:L,D-peptidoglycan transpeptidase YkuD (ErfK/YbiS/YcfS/YnhG family)